MRLVCIRFCSLSSEHSLGKRSCASCVQYATSSYILCISFITQHSITFLTHCLQYVTSSYIICINFITQFLITFFTHCLQHIILHHVHRMHHTGSYNILDTVLREAFKKKSMKHGKCSDIREFRV